MSSTPTHVAVSPLTAMLRHWRLSTALAVLGALLGVLLGSMTPSTNTAETRVAVGPGDMSAGAIAGFPEASRSMAADYARWVTSAAIANGGTTVSASPVPDSNVISIESEARDAQTAITAAQQAADALVAQVNQGRDLTDPEKTLAELQKQATAWSKASTQLDLANQRFGTSSTATTGAALSKAKSDEAVQKAKLDAQTDKYRQQVSQASQAADLRIVQKAQIVKNNAWSLRERYGLLGLAVGLLAGLVLATVRERRRVARAVATS